MKQIEEESKIKKWQTVDGMKFNYPEDAERWEDSLEMVALHQIEDVFNYIDNDLISNIDYFSDMFNMSCECNYYVFEPRDHDDIKNLLMYVQLSKLDWRYTCKNYANNLIPNKKYLFMKDEDYCAIVSQDIIDDFFKQRRELLQTIFDEN